MTTATTIVQPAVWIGCLACYNNGILNGNWVPVENVEDISHKDLHHGRAELGHDELWCFDIEGFPAGTGEMDPLTAAHWGELYLRIGEHLWEPFLEWVDNGGHTLDGDGLPDASTFMNAYRGRYDDFSDYIRNTLEECSYFDGWPDEATRYFNWNSYQNDAKHDHTVLRSSDGGVYVFVDH